MLSATWYICSYPASYARTSPVIPRTSSLNAHMYDVRGRCALLCSDVLCCWLCSIMCYTVTNYRNYWLASRPSTKGPLTMSVNVLVTRHCAASSIRQYTATYGTDLREHNSLRGTWALCLFYGRVLYPSWVAVFL